MLKNYWKSKYIYACHDWGEFYDDEDKIILEYDYDDDNDDDDNDNDDNMKMTTMVIIIMIVMSMILTIVVVVMIILFVWQNAVPVWEPFIVKHCKFHFLNFI